MKEACSVAMAAGWQLLVLRGWVGQIWEKLVSYLVIQLIGANSLCDDHWPFVSSHSDQVTWKQAF